MAVGSMPWPPSGSFKVPCERSMTKSGIGCVASPEGMTPIERVEGIWTHVESHGNGVYEC